MAALTAAQQRDVWSRILRDNDASLGSALSKVDLDAAVAAIDAWCEANQASFVAALPQPFKGATTAAQKAVALAYVAMKRAGVI